MPCHPRPAAGAAFPREVDMTGLATLALAALSCGEPFVDARDGQRYPTVAHRRPVLDGAQPRPRRGRPGRGPPRPVGDREELLRQRPESCRVYGGLYTWDEAKGSCPAGWHLPTPRRVGGARRPPRDGGRRREAQGAEGPRAAVRRDGRRRLHGAARGHGLPGLLRPAGPLGGLLDGHGERARARGLGHPRPLLAPAAAALPEAWSSTTSTSRRTRSRCDAHAPEEPAPQRLPRAQVPRDLPEPRVLPRL